MTLRTRSPSRGGTACTPPSRHSSHAANSANAARDNRFTHDVPSGPVADTPTSTHPPTTTTPVAHADTSPNLGRNVRYGSSSRSPGRPGSGNGSVLMPPPSHTPAHHAAGRRPWSEARRVDPRHEDRARPHLVQGVHDLVRAVPAHHRAHRRPVAVVQRR